MRIVFLALIIIANFFFQSTFINGISIAGVTPNMPIAIVVSYAVLRGSTPAAVIGFIMGLLSDIFFGGAIGFYAIIFMYIGILCGIPSKHIFKNSFLLPFFFAFFSTLAFGFVTYVFQHLLRGRTDFSEFFVDYIIIQVIYTSIVAIIIYAFFYFTEKLFKAIEPKKRTLY